MKRLSLCVLLLSSIVLVGCATDGSNAPPLVTPTQVSTVIADVQAKVATGCSIAVKTQSIAAILDAIGVPYVGMVSDIAKQVCDAFSTKTVRRGLAIPSVRVNGKVIVLQGRRV